MEIQEFKNRHEMLQKIAKHLGEPLTSWDGKIEWIYAKECGIGKIEACGDDTVKISVEVSPDIAIKIIDLIRGL